MVTELSKDVKNIGYEIFSPLLVTCNVLEINPVESIKVLSVANVRSTLHRDLMQTRIRTALNVEITHHRAK